MNIKSIIELVVLKRFRETRVSFIVEIRHSIYVIPISAGILFHFNLQNRIKKDIPKIVANENVCMKITRRQKHLKIKRKLKYLCQCNMITYN